MTEGFVDGAQVSALRNNADIILLKSVDGIQAGKAAQICPACGKRVHFIKTVKGKMMPCEIDIKRGDGRMTLTGHDGVTHRKAPDTVFGYESHFAFCLKADQYRHSRGGAR